MFTLEEGKLNVDQSVINSLNPIISPKNNPISTVAIIENNQVSSGKYTNGSSGVRYYSTIYLFDCSKNAVTYKEDVWGSEPPESGYVRSGGKIKGTTVSANDKANFILSHLK